MPRRPDRQWRRAGAHCYEPHARSCARLQSGYDPPRQTFLFRQKGLERSNRRHPTTRFRPQLCEPIHERPHRLSRPKARSALQAYAAVSAGRRHHAVQEDHGRGRPGREGIWQGHDGGVAGSAAGAERGGVRRHQPLPAAGPSQAVAQHPRRQGSQRQRQVRRLRFPEERQHRRRRRAADVPGHRHRHHHGQEGFSRHHRRRRRGRALGRRARRLSAPQPALFAGGAAVDV